MEKKDSDNSNDFDDLDPNEFLNKINTNYNNNLSTDRNFFVTNNENDSESNNDFINNDDDISINNNKEENDDNSEEDNEEDNLIESIDMKWSKKLKNKLNDVKNNIINKKNDLNEIKNNMKEELEVEYKNKIVEYEKNIKKEQIEKIEKIENKIQEELEDYLYRKGLNKNRIVELENQYKKELENKYLLENKELKPLIILEKELKEKYKKKVKLLKLNFKKLDYLKLKQKEKFKLDYENQLKIQNKKLDKYKGEIGQEKSRLYIQLKNLKTSKENLENDIKNQQFKFNKVIKENKKVMDLLKEENKLLKKENKEWNKLNGVLSEKNIQLENIHKTNFNEDEIEDESEVNKGKLFIPKIFNKIFKNEILINKNVEENLNENIVENIQLTNFNNIKNITLKKESNKNKFTFKPIKTESSKEINLNISEKNNENNTDVNDEKEDKDLILKLVKSRNLNKEKTLNIKHQSLQLNHNQIKNLEDILIKNDLIKNEETNNNIEFYNKLEEDKNKEFSKILLGLNKDINFNKSKTKKFNNNNKIFKEIFVKNLIDENLKDNILDMRKTILNQLENDNKYKENFFIISEKIKENNFRLSLENIMDENDKEIKLNYLNTFLNELNGLLEILNLSYEERYRIMLDLDDKKSFDDISFFYKKNIIYFQNIKDKNNDLIKLLNKMENIRSELILSINNLKEENIFYLYEKTLNNYKKLTNVCKNISKNLIKIKNSKIEKKYKLFMWKNISIDKYIKVYSFEQLYILKLKLKEELVKKIKK